MQGSHRTSPKLSTSLQSMGFVLGVGINCQEKCFAECPPLLEKLTELSSYSKLFISRHFKTSLGTTHHRQPPIVLNFSFDIPSIMVFLQGSRRHDVCTTLLKFSRRLEELLRSRRRHHHHRTLLSSASSLSHQVRYCGSTPPNQHDVSSTGHTPRSQNRFQNKKRVVVAMSGGVDSSVAAYLLQRISRNGNQSSYHPDTSLLDTPQNNDCGKGGDDDATNNSVVDIVGLHMSNWNALDEDSDVPAKKHSSTNNNRRRRRGQQVSKIDASKVEPTTRQSTEETSYLPPQQPSKGTTFCQTSENEYNDANSVAQHLDLPIHRVSFASEYWIQVFEPFIESLSSSSSLSEDEDFTNNGHQQMTMPNPDYGCNTYIKFGAMKDYAMNKLNADYVATGHYAQLWHRDYLTSLDEQSKYCESPFHQWMSETSQSLEKQVIDSISGRPEEDWILDNHTQSSGDVPPLPMLLAGVDRSKDQTYFLSGVKGQALRNVIFPLGHLAKSQSATQVDNNNDNDNSYQTVRDIALQANIPTASKRDSMGICFIGKRNFGQFVSQYLPETPQPGNFVDVDTGEIVGRHEGAVLYTLGEGARISGAKLRYFVCGKGGAGVRDDNDDANTVFVCNSTHHPALYADELFVDFHAFNWIGLGDGDVVQGQSNDYNHIPRPLLEGRSLTLLARVRHLQPLTPCTVTWNRSDKNKSGDKGYLTVRFDKAMRAITPGQIVALYAGADGLVCLGGGIITGPGASYMDRGLDVTAGMLHPSGYNDLSLRNT
eukprot:scaffold23914_cov138-Skeletonema_marinoi.AAC.2